MLAVDKRDLLVFNYYNMPIKKEVFLVLVAAATLGVLPSIFGVKAETRLQQKCLKKTQCSKLTAGQSCLNNSLSPHRVRLEVDPTSAESILEKGDYETFVTDCVEIVDPTDTNPNVNQRRKVYKCTTGNNELDKKAFRNDNANFYNELVAAGYNMTTPSDYGIWDVNGEVMGKGQKIDPPRFFTSKSNRTLPVIEWQSSTPQEISHNFFSWQWVEGQPPVNDQGTTQQQGTIPFEGGNGICAGIKWDPDGRVFDALTLEPVTNGDVSLSLLKKYRTDGGGACLRTDSDSICEYRTALESEYNIPSSMKTDFMGGFRFFVSNGWYQLQVVPNVSLTFPVAELNQINSNYNKIYNDIYPAGTGPEIWEENKMEHRDIPLISSTGTKYFSQLTVNPQPAQLIKGTGSLLLQGQASHPCVYVAVKQKDFRTGALEDYPKSFITDNKGNYIFSLPQKVDKKYVVQFNKTDLTNANLNCTTKMQTINHNQKTTLASVKNQPVTIEYDPIPNYVVGVVQNQQAQAVPGAEVQVTLVGSGVVYYQTSADNKGNFTISSEYLPSYPYQLVYVLPSKEKIKLTAADFLAQNQANIKNQKINVYEYKNQQGEIIKVVTPTAFRSGPVNTNVHVTGSGNPQLKNLILTAVILAVLLVIVVTILIVYMLKRKTPLSGQ